MPTPQASFHYGQSIYTKASQLGSEAGSIKAGSIKAPSLKSQKAGSQQDARSVTKASSKHAVEPDAAE